MIGRRGAVAIIGFFAWSCGVAGRPMPPGPLPPSPPSDVRLISTPEGVEIHGPRQHRDVDGELIEGPVELRLIPDDSATPGRTLARAKGAPIRVARPISGGVVRLVAYRGRSASRPSAPFTLSWSAPPSAPTPIGFMDDGGRTRLMWPPVDGGVGVTVLRDGEVVANMEPGSTAYTERAPGARHEYQIVLRGETFRSGPSAAVQLTRLTTQ